MKTGDKEHYKLLKVAVQYSQDCRVCWRHCNKMQDFDYLKYINPNNLLKHLIAAHNYRPKKWWQIWR